MPKNDISPQAFGLLADMADVVRELLNLCAIWPSSFGDLDHVPFGVTPADFEFTRNLADA
jgi:hypothetical protein